MVKMRLSFSTFLYACHSKLSFLLVTDQIRGYSSLDSDWNTYLHSYSTTPWSASSHSVFFLQPLGCVADPLKGRTLCQRSIKPMSSISIPLESHPFAKPNNLTNSPSQQSGAWPFPEPALPSHHPTTSFSATGNLQAFAFDLEAQSDETLRAPLSSADSSQGEAITTRDIHFRVVHEELYDAERDPCRGETLDERVKEGQFVKPMIAAAVMLGLTVAGAVVGVMHASKSRAW